jgi:transcriptional repressor NF-X1
MLSNQGLRTFLSSVSPYLHSLTVRTFLTLCFRPCHPGPCPPCVLVVQRQCYCGSTTQSLRCSQLKASLPPSLSCGSPCRKPLSCNKHQCQVECHEGPCPLCDKKDFVQCYCGKEEKFVACGEGVARECRVVEEEEEKSWEGRYECDALCERPFKCGVHTCQKVRSSRLHHRMIFISSLPTTSNVTRLR